MGNVHPNTKVERENLAPLDRYIMVSTLIYGCFKEKFMEEQSKI